MKVTVIICTWNRSHLLDKTLTAMRGLEIPAGVEWEILVVNNNSSDDTDDIIARHSALLPLRRLFEPRPGKSFAANLALRETSGDLIVWTDDDVLPNPDWLTQYVRAAEQWPEAVYFVGAIDPWFEAEPPPWIRRHLAKLSGIYAIIDHGPTPRPAREREGVFGANMAFRTRVAKEFPLNVQLGRIEGELIGGDDTELIERVRKAGYVGMCIPTARVKHYVPAARLNVAYVQKWFRGAGRNHVRQGAGELAGATFCGAPRWVWRRYWQASVVAWCLWPWKGKRWLRALREAAIMRGVIQETRLRNRRAECPATPPSAASVENPA